MVHDDSNRLLYIEYCYYMWITDDVRVHNNKYIKVPREITYTLFDLQIPYGTRVVGRLRFTGISRHIRISISFYKEEERTI